MLSVAVMANRVLIQLPEMELLLNLWNSKVSSLQGVSEGSVAVVPTISKIAEFVVWKICLNRGNVPSTE